MPDRKLKIMSHALSRISECVWATDPSGRIIYANRAFQEATGYTETELQGSPDRLLWESEDAWETSRTMARRSFTGTWEGDGILRRKDGGEVTMAISASILKGERGEDTAVVWMAVNNVDQRLEEALSGISHLDGLTGLPDRPRFEDVLEQEWRRAQRLRFRLSVILADVDHFRAYNDLYGPRAGDQCLRLLAGEMRGALRRPGDLAARFGGQVFSLLLQGANRETAASFAERLRGKVEALHLPHDGAPGTGFISVTLGAASTLPGKDARPAELVAVAEEALREAKEDGVNRVRVLELKD